MCLFRSRCELSRVKKGTSVTVTSWLASSSWKSARPSRSTWPVVRVLFLLLLFSPLIWTEFDLFHLPTTFHVRLPGLILCSTCDRKPSITLLVREEVSKVSGALVGCVHLISMNSSRARHLLLYLVHWHTSKSSSRSVYFRSQPDSCSTYAFINGWGEQSFRCVSGTSNHLIHLRLINVCIHFNEKSRFSVVIIVIRSVALFCKNVMWSSQYVRPSFLLVRL